MDLKHLKYRGFSEAGAGHFDARGIRKMEHKSN
jgi:hypothetical protein